MPDGDRKIVLTGFLARFVEKQLKKLGISFEEYVRRLIERDDSLGTLEERREAHRKMRALGAASEETDSSQN